MTGTGRHGLRERLVGDRAGAEAVVELGQDPVPGAVLDAEIAAGTGVLVDVAGLPAHLDPEVAHIAGDLLHLAEGQQVDVRVLADLHHLRSEDAGRAVERREGLVELGHLAADARLPLHQVDMLAGVGEGERRMDPPDPAADDKHVRVHRRAAPVQLLVRGNAPHRAGDERARLRRRVPAIGGHPAHVLADARHLGVKGTDPAGLRRPPERRPVHERRARGDDDPVHQAVADVLLDQLLARVRAHELVVARDRHARQRGGERDDALDIHLAGDVMAAVAHVHADLRGQRRLRAVCVRPGHGHLPPPRRAPAAATAASGARRAPAHRARARSPAIA